MEEKASVDQSTQSRNDDLHTYSSLFYRFRSQSPGEQEQAWVTIETALQFNDEHCAAMMDLFWSALWEQTDWEKNTAGWSSALTASFPIVCGDGMWKHDEAFVPFPFMELPDGRCIAKYSEFLRAVRNHYRRQKRPLPDFIDLNYWMCTLSLWYILESVTIHDFGYVGKEYHIYWNHKMGLSQNVLGKAQRRGQA